MSHTKIRALQQWCKALVDGYKDVNITNMSSSWRDGLAFCALIHRFRPDLINFDVLSKSNVYDNNQLAFTVAENLGIPALLEAKDMYDLPVPDKLSVITYVASMHNYFKDKEKLGGPGVSSYKGGNIQIGMKRHQDNDPLNITEPKRSTPDQSEERNQKIGSSPTRQRSPADDLCTLCQGKVYLIEKQIDNGKLYHRSCFRSSRMSPASKILSKNLSNGADYITANINDNLSVPDIHTKVEQTANITAGDNSKSQTKVRLYEKKKEQIQKAEEKLKAEKQKELYEKRQNAPSALRNHLKNIDNQIKENSKSSSDSLASRSSESYLIAKQSSPERDLTKAHSTTEQPSWAQTKLRKVFDDPISSSPTAMSLGKVASSRRDSSSCAEEKQSRESSPGSPVLMQQVTSRTMEDRQYRASRSVTKSSTNLEAESGKQQLVSGLLKSLANIRQRPPSANTASPTSPPPSPKLPSGAPPFSKLSAAQRATSPVPTATNGLSFGQPLNSMTPAQPVLTSTPLQAKTNDVKMQAPAKTVAPAPQKEQAKSVARIKTVIKSTPANPATPKIQPSAVVPVSTTSALSAKSKVTNGSVSPSESLAKPVASMNATETASPHRGSSKKSNVTSGSSPSHSASSAKSNVSKITPESSLSRSSSPKSNVSNASKITLESSPSHSASSVKSSVSKNTLESSLSRSSSPKSNISNASKITLESSPSHSASSAKSSVSKITSESSLSRSSSPKSNISNASKITSESSPSHSASSAKSSVSKITSESSLSRSSSPKSNISNASKITSESSPSPPVSSTKSNVSKITLESSPSHSVSPAKSNVTKFTSETSLSRSSSPKSNISNVSKITSESSPSHSASSTRSNLSKITAPPQITSPTKSALSKATVDTASISTSTTNKLSMTKDDKPQSLLERIEQYSKVAAGVEKPPSEPSPIREIILSHNDSDKQDRRSSLKQNELTTTPATTCIAVKKPLASESTKERNTVSRHIATPKKVGNKPETVCMPAPVVKTFNKDGHAPSKAEITKSVKQPSLGSYSVSQTQPNKSSMTVPNPKRLGKEVENTNSTTNTNAVSTSGVFSTGLTKLHPAHYTPKSSDSSPNSNLVSPNTATVQSLDMRVNPIPKPKRQKAGLIPNVTKENKENPAESKPNHSNGANFHKTSGALSERQDTGDDSKTEWQLEAERRIAARKGKYIDPETHITRFVLPDSATRLDNEKNGDANQNTRPVGLKKISVAQSCTFNFDDSLNSNTSLDFPYRKHIMPKQDLDSLEWSNPKKRLSTDEIQKELTNIDSKLTDLELRGRQLEVSIRAANEDDEKFMVEWFQLINEKNELVRRENDLIYQSQEQELEEEQIRIDKELQTLLMKPYEKKSKAEKRKEEELIQQKIAVVNQRNLIVESIDEDRLRYKEEDEGIKEVLQSKGYLKIESLY